MSNSNYVNPIFSFENPDSELGFDIPDFSLFEMLKFKKDSHPDALAYEYMGISVTFSEFVEKIIEASYAYSSLGVKKGDIVTILMPNTPEAVIGIYALNRIGAVCDILHPLLAPNEIKDFLNASRSKYLLTVDLFADKVKEIYHKTSLKKVIVTSPVESLSVVMKVGYKLTDKNKNKKYLEDKQFIKYSKFMKNKLTTAEYDWKDVNNSTVSIILHSGGTTGTPKSIMLSNKNFNAFAVQSVLTLRDVSVGDKMLAILPIFHGFGLGVCIHVAFCFGASTVLIPSFNSKKFGDILKKYKPSMLFGVPTLYEALISNKDVDKLDLSFLKYAISGGDTLPKTLENKVNKFLASHNSKIKISEGYGMTEGLAALSLSVNEGYKSGTIGRPLIGNKICVVEPGTIEHLPCNTDGELCICGPTVMLGYRNNEEETNSTLRVHADGNLWLHTGDIVSIDEENFITYKSRIKRLIISSGYNIYPNYVEKVVEEHPDVKQCVLVSMPHPYKKAVGKAYILPEDGVEPSDELVESIKGYCKENLAHFCVPYKFEFVTSIPKTAYNKVDYKQFK